MYSMVAAKGSVSRWFRAAMAVLIGMGMLIGLNWCFSEIALTLKLATGQDAPQLASAAVNFVGVDNPATAKDAPATTPKDAPVPEAAGRHDPFAPLAEDPNANGGIGKTAAAQIGKDPFLGVQFTGIVHSRHPGGALAMMQVNDPLLGVTTVIRKAGEVIDMPGGQTAKLVQVSNQQIVLNMGGKSRPLPLRPLLEEPATPSQSNTSNTLPPSANGLGKPVGLPTNAVR